MQIHTFRIVVRKPNGEVVEIRDFPPNDGGEVETLCRMAAWAKENEERLQSHSLMLSAY